MTPNDVQPFSGRIVWWKCPVSPDHEWQATIVSRTAGHGVCPFCHRAWTTDDVDAAIQASVAVGIIPRHRKGDATQVSIGGGRRCTWVAVDLALRYGNNGLPGGDSLANRVSLLFPEHGSRTGTWNEDEIAALVRIYQSNNPDCIPNAATSDAIMLLGREYSWRSVVGAFAKGTHGLPEMSFSAWCVSKGLHESTNDYSGLSLSDIKRLLMEWAKDHGGAFPSAATKEAAANGMPWHGIASRAKALGTTLKDLKTELGLVRVRATEVDPQRLPAAMAMFVTKFGRLPSSDGSSATGDDDASLYLGYPPNTVSWKSVYRAYPDEMARLRKNALPTLNRTKVAKGIEALLRDNPGTLMKDHMRKSSFPYTGLDLLWTSVRDRVGRGEVEGCPPGTRMMDVSPLVTMSNAAKSRVSEKPSQTASPAQSSSRWTESRARRIKALLSSGQPVVVAYNDETYNVKPERLTEKDGKPVLVGLNLDTNKHLTFFLHKITKLEVMK